MDSLENERTVAEEEFEEEGEYEDEDFNLSNEEFFEKM